MCVVDDTPQVVESCMFCHNGSRRNDYAGRGLKNPHPFPPAANISCTGCHGGNPDGETWQGSHVPPPPSIGGPILGRHREYYKQNVESWTDRLTMAGLDKREQEYSYAERPGETFTALEYIQFINPGDLRVVSKNLGCGAQGCHANEHAQWVPRSTIATSTGLFSSTRFGVGVENRIPEHRASQSPGGLNDTDGDSLASSAPRAVQNPGYNPATREVGEVGQLVEQPERAVYGQPPLYDNPAFNAANLENDVINANQDPLKPNRVRLESNLELLVDEQVSITCGNCHLYSAGANNRYADYRSSGCTACHMEYTMSGRSSSGDPNVDKEEPRNVDAIDQANFAERPHIEAHEIRNVFKILPNRGLVRGISDRACVGCHQGSNRTVLQYWGIRMDQNADVANNNQYPANPDNFTDTANDNRLYNQTIGNNTFNGREANQHLLTEDYDGDGRDDTPPDVHYEAGMGCIDCHGSRDLHGGTRGDQSSGQIKSHQDQDVAISCANCHGSVDGYATTTDCVDYEGNQATCAVDKNGNAMRHVTRNAGDGNYYIKTRTAGQIRYVPQTKDVIFDTGKVHPLKPERGLIYNPKASYAMGRNDGQAATGIGPRQNNIQGLQANFSHMDTMDCASCHASWTNNCIGCHLATAYNANPDNYFFSNITGERIQLQEQAADFVYQSPIMMYLGVNSRGKITQISPAEKVFWRYQDINGDTSKVFAFSDRLGEGNNPNTAGRNAFPALAMNQMAPHSIRGRVSVDQEGPRYCVSCHITQNAVNNYDNEYRQFLAAYQNNDFANINFNVLQEHIGQNTGNQLDSPFFPRMVSGMGSALFLFDEFGCPVNPLDNNANREYCQNGAPANNFNANNVVYDLDRVVEFNGTANSSSSHPLLGAQGPTASRGNVSNSLMAGPLGGQTLYRLMGNPNDANNPYGLVLDAWLDADGEPQGNAADYIQNQ